MRILLTGIDGYCGWPLALSISKKYPKCQIIGVDKPSDIQKAEKMMKGDGFLEQYQKKYL